MTNGYHIMDNAEWKREVEGSKPSSSIAKQETQVKSLKYTSVYQHHIRLHGLYRPVVANWF